MTTPTKRKPPRLGRVEEAVLECLRFEGKASNADDLALGIQIRSGNGPVVRPTPLTAWVSIRRAINSLARKRMVRLGHPVRHLQHDPDRRIVCWLPEHEAPELIVRTTRRQFRTLILESLRNIDAAKIPQIQEDAVRYHHIPNWVIDLYTPYPGDVPYHEIIEPIVRKAPDDGNGDARFRMALYRATLSLIKDGEIKGLVIMDNSYTKQKRRIFYIRLTDVA